MTDVIDPPWQRPLCDSDAAVKWHRPVRTVPTPDPDPDDGPRPYVTA
jgi:hypothetical protein